MLSYLTLIFQKEIGVWGKAPFRPFVYTKGQKSEKKKEGRNTTVK